MNNFILIDDNKIDLLIASKAISMSGIEYEQILDFMDARKALSFIEDNDLVGHTIVFVDIKMPIMDGFAFMKAFSKLSEEKRNQFTCMFLTSSLNDVDNLRAQQFDDVKAYLNKPLSGQKLNDVFKKLSL